ELLARSDKWYLGCGDGVLFAPPFPTWLDTPGFWDEATVHQHAIGPLFTVTFLDHEGRELPATLGQRRWTPAELSCRYTLPGDIEAIEVRTVQPGGVFVSEWRLHANVPVLLHAVAWTAQDTAQLDLPSVRWDGAALGFVRPLPNETAVAARVVAELTCLGGATSWAASLAERTPLQPLWGLAPFAEQWRRDALSSRVRVSEVTPDGVMYAAVHRALARGVTDLQVTFALRITLEGRDRRSRSPARAYTPRSSAALAGAATLGGMSRRRWQEMFDLAPRFTCSDPYFERYYWYRWYGLWLNATAPGVGMYRFPTVCEGIGPFHRPAAHSAPCHVRELRWLADPQLARGTLRSFLEHQQPDGSLPGHVHVDHLTRDTHNANWGDAIIALDAVAPDDAFVAVVYPALARYANWLLAARDSGRTGMFDVGEANPAGAESDAHYTAVDGHADAESPTVKGVDATVYAYTLLRALEVLAARAGVPDEAALWHNHAARSAAAVRTRMWDPAAGLFCDVDARTGSRARMQTVAGFYPYCTDLAQDAHLAGLTRTLQDPALFWTTYPVPTLALTDSLFSATAEWRGKRHARPWSGRVWPVSNSHIVEALGRWATA
ncbi:MAG: MGH1-like glycoside hydrolase domain-containing protein, partial [Gemmatimonadaceae bacterium]